MTPRRRRMIGVGLVVLGVGAAVGLTLKAFDNNVMLFLSPTQVLAGEAPVDRPFRLGGHVVDGSFKRAEASLTATFVVTDNNSDLLVEYTGVFPDLFKEGQATVAKGTLNAEGVFVADEVLAKHDENYMPPEVAKMLEEQGKAAEHSANQPNPASGQ
jgi:cytochrome c-type biogenesis protein CcmE